MKIKELIETLKQFEDDDNIMITDNDLYVFENKFKLYKHGKHEVRIVLNTGFYSDVFDYDHE